ncbi:hypothetical protein SNE40_004934 [Patella caerulea]|uniref:Uncharacterized protein n=1 Tax=Patella caerulea TaxID=87958 RepID=A0AAN8KD38_PATCE
MTKPGMNHNLENVSLTRRSGSPVIDDHFYCSCEITADNDDVYIDTRVSFLGLKVGTYNGSVTIYSRDYTVRYDANNTDMTPVDIAGYTYLINKQIKRTKGPIYLVYEGDKLDDYYERIWIDYKGKE